jgi:hypothetical protein
MTEIAASQKSNIKWLTPFPLNSTVLGINKAKRSALAWGSP